MTLPADSSIIVNIIVAVLIVLSMIFGYIKGFLWQVIKIVGIIAVFLLAWILAPGLSDLVQIIPKDFIPFAETPLGPLFYDKINVVCWFLIVFVVGVIILLILNPLFKVITELPIIKPVNKALGVIFALVPTFVLILVMTYVLNSVIFTNGKDVVNQSVLKYTIPIVDKASTLVSGVFKENVAIQKMLNDPKSLDSSDLQSIIDWMKSNKIEANDILEFLKNYGIDVDSIKDLISSGLNK